MSSHAALNEDEHNAFTPSGRRPDMSWVWIRTSLPFLPSAHGTKGKRVAQTTCGLGCSRVTLNQILEKTGWEGARGHTTEVLGYRGCRGGDACVSKCSVAAPDGSCGTLFVTVPRFTVPLPIPVKATPVAPNTYHITQRQTQQTLHPKLGPTKVWGYDDGRRGPLYPGPTIEVGEERRPRSATGTAAHKPPAAGRHEHRSRRDPTVRTLTHLHGGFVSAPTMATLTRRIQGGVQAG